VGDQGSWESWEVVEVSVSTVACGERRVLRLALNSADGVNAEAGDAPFDKKSNALPKQNFIFAS